MFLENRTTKLLALIAALGLLTASFLFGFGVGRSTKPSTADRYGLLEEAEKIVQQSALKDLDHSALVQGAVRGMLGTLKDPYSEFLDERAYTNFQQITSGSFSGVGLWLKDDEGNKKIVGVLPNTPAEASGIKEGDIVLKVDGRDVRELSLDLVAQRIQGREGTQVKVTVLRGDQPLDFDLTRKVIELPVVESKTLPSRLGLVRLITFSSGAGDKLRGAVKDLVGKGVRGLVLDLRGNPGGLVDEAVKATSVFVDGGTVVTFRERGKPERVFEASGEPATKLPLVVLVDEGSASAAEILAGAIQDRGRGILVGTTTYGKGSVQTIFPLSDGSAIKLTTASYFTPSGRSIAEKGIEPDVAVADKQQQLAEAQEILKGILADRPRRAG